VLDEFLRAIDDGYGSRDVLGPESSVAPLAAPSARILVSDLLP
jgi:hypothetical protein